ncbi:acetyltransferase [Capsulimonas corticalis]|uniref:Acetyltransferase n=1 Tax=Capsulimonas corticalis TaxID=2219043 RepID=A0A402CTN5_9BACT|nr:GNAT family N-acetyltransferase [Capsulimonas corticalis]BDI30647.1 acetyltransferase [Capsulimonas corticalis]
MNDDPKLPALTLRLARLGDADALAELIPLSAHALQADYYTPIQIEAALGPIFGVDRQLIADGTYFVVEAAGRIVGCGGWSRRKTLFGGDDGRNPDDDSLLDPTRDSARVRAFFVHPEFARRGIGRRIMSACEDAILQAGFRDVEIVATLAGEPLYAVFGYHESERFEIPMRDGLTLPVVRMRKRLAPS